MKTQTILKSFVVFLITFIFFTLPTEASWRPRKYFKEIPDPPDYKMNDMTGDWVGFREKLYDSGVTVASTFVCDFLANVSGGRRRGGRYDHSLGLDINVDLEKLADIKGMQFHVAGLYRYGESLSSDIIDNKIVVSSIYGHEQLRFYTLYLEQSLFDDILDIQVGRLAAGDDFARSEIYWIYVNNGIDGVPINLPINFAFSVYPTATWGARSKINITDDIYATTGVYSADPDVGNDDMHGLDFSLRLSRGLLYMQELAYTPNTKKDSKGLPGHYKAGVYLVGGKLDDLYADSNGNSYLITGEAPKKHRTSYGFYAHADQMLYREGNPGSDQGLSAFAIATISPDDTNLLPFLVNAGVFYKGLIPGRDHDITAFGLSYVKWSADATHSQEIQNELTGSEAYPSRQELLIEFTNKFQINQWMFVQPDLQVIFYPGGTSKVPNALVIGTRFGVTF